MASSDPSSAHVAPLLCPCLQVPIRLVLSEDLGLRGAHVKAARVLLELSRRPGALGAAVQDMPSKEIGALAEHTFSLEKVAIAVALSVLVYTLYQRHGTK